MERHRQLRDMKLPIKALDQIGSRAPSSIYDARPTSLNQLQSSQTCVTILADDEVVVDGMPSGVAIWTIALVIWISGCDGVG
jgi:hypothetical protein